ncbi:hypothetical protein BYT27DRAFT_7258929 [Phlegmacium glaucopus]|nr:hypothetical protein BYT27DRAFT_7258929 [Phlegmacium glaucopus]
MFPNSDTTVNPRSATTPTVTIRTHNQLQSQSPPGTVAVATATQNHREGPHLAGKEPRVISKAVFFHEVRMGGSSYHTLDHLYIRRVFPGQQRSTSTVPTACNSMFSNFTEKKSDGEQRFRLWS